MSVNFLKHWSKVSKFVTNVNCLASVVQKVDNTVHWIILYPVDNAISLGLFHWVVISPVDSTIQRLNNQGLNTLQKGKMFGSSCTTSKSKYLVCKGQCRPSSADCAVLVLCVLKNSAVNLCWRYKNKKCSNVQWGLAWACTCIWFEFI